MKEMLNNYINKLEEKIESKDFSKDLKDEALTNIQFFQHERLVHLIVTFMTGVAAILFLLGYLITEVMPLLLLFFVTLLLFIPYIFHYYTLENGVQKLYDLYFKIK